MDPTELTLDDDNFDDAFFEEIDKWQSMATSSTQPPPPQPPQPPPPPPLQQQQQQQQQEQQQQQQEQQQYSYYFNSKPSSSFTSAYSPPPQLAHSSIIDNIHTHSPPRHLSQRIPNNNTHSTTSTRSVSSPFTDEQTEIDRLKNELSCVSKELLDLKQECSELKKQKDKEHQLKFVHSNKKAKACNSGDHFRTEISLRCENVNVTASPIAKEKKSTGMQTDGGDESLNPSTSGTASTYGDLPKLLSIWFSLRSQRSQRHFVAKLLEACASDFCALFGCLGHDMTSKMNSECLVAAPMPGKSLGPHPAEVPGVAGVIAKNKSTSVAQLYSVLTKLADDMVHINAFVEVLLDLCSLDNALIVHSSLRILHISLDHILSMARVRPKRDNVKVKRCSFGSDAVHTSIFEVGKPGGLHDVSGDETSHASFMTACKNICVTERETLSFPCHVDWLHLFMSMCQIAVKLTEERARIEAVSIMNLTLTETDYCSDRAKFGGSLVFKAVAYMLRKEAGFLCRKEAVHLLYLLLNCPNILATFCSSCKEANTQSATDGAISLPCQESCAVLEGLAECMICSEHGAKELNLRRNAIIVLSFLASSGKCGFETFLFHKLSKGANFLGLVLQVLVSEIDAEALGFCSAPEISKERTLLMREALILLNRLASHPAYSSSVLQVLTSCRDMVSLAIDVATRLSKKSRMLLKSDPITRQKREHEVVELACLFKKRVFTFLGESISS